MFQSKGKTALCPTDTCIVISSDGEYGLCATGTHKENLLDFLSSSIAATFVDYQINESSVELKNCSINENNFLYLMMRYDDLTFKETIRVKKNIQAALVNMGYEVIDVYGFEVNGYLYGRDMGFEIRLTEYLSAFVNFGLIRKVDYGRTAYGYSFPDRSYILHNLSRKSGTFKDSLFRLDTSFIPAEILRQFPDVKIQNIRVLSDLSISVQEIYSDLSENVIKFIQFGDSNEYALSLTLCDSTEIAITTRQQGSAIFQRIATNPSLTSGLSNVATAKILSADAVESLGNIALIGTSNSGIISSMAEFKKKRFEFLSNDVPDEKLQYELAYSAGVAMGILGSFKTISKENIDFISNAVLGKIPDEKTNFYNHSILGANGENVGYLSNTGNVNYCAISDISAPELYDIVFQENVLEKNEYLKVATEAVCSNSERNVLCKNLEVYRAKAALINENDILSNIRRIDLYCAESFKTLASLISSTELINARAATYLKAVDAILRFPLKTAYGAIDFGILAEFIDVNVNADGSSVIKAKYDLDHLVPYQKSLHTVQCFKTWCVMNSDPGKGYENDILIGSAYASSLSDLQGNYVTTKTKRYVKTNRQTRGSGKSEQEVIPETTLEPRVVAKFSDFLQQMVIFLDRLLNNDVMKIASQASICVKRLTDAVKKYGDMRLPYRDQLVELVECREMIFCYNHMIKLLDWRMQEGELDFGQDVSFVPSEVKHFISSEQVARVNSISSLITKVDKKQEIPIFQEDGELAELASSLHTLISNSRELSGENLDENDGRSGASTTDEVTNLYETVTVSCFYNEEELVNSDPECGIISGNNNINGSKKKTWSVKINAEYVNELLALVDSINDIYQRKLTFINEFKKKIIKVMSEADLFEFAGQGSLEQEEDSIKVIVNDSELYHYDIIKEIKTDNQDSVNETSQTYKGMYTVRLVFNPAESKLPAKDVGMISLGNFKFEIDKFMKHYLIFGIMPKNDNIVKQLKYVLFSSTDRSDEDVITVLKEKYDLSISNSAAMYLAIDSSSYNNIYSTLLLASISNIKECLTFLSAFQSETLLQLLDNKKLGASSVSVFASKASSLIS